jgi:predicted nuclease of restriction endonuclease-like (RecB) superfamily
MFSCNQNWRFIMKSKTDEITEKAFYHALNFFKSNDRGVDNQRVCIQQLMEITGFDFDTCLKIQNPVLSLYMAIDTMSIGQSVIESNIQMVTQTIRNHLLDVQINYSQKTFDQKSSNSILSCKDIIEKTTNEVAQFV